MPASHDPPAPTRRHVLAGLAGAAAFGRVSLATAAAPPGRRVALVIGNGAYRQVPELTNPPHDARLIAGTLAELGFELAGGGAQIDLDHAAFAAAIRRFGQQIRGAEVALFYYSGHGMQVGGRNWLVPISADPRRLSDLPVQMIDADAVLRAAVGAGTELNIVILDACRDDPFALPGTPAPTATPILQPTPGPGRSGTRGLGGGGGLAVMQAPPGTLISYATQPGNVALDGNGLNSPFTAALAKVMRRPGISLFRMFNDVGVLVERATEGTQQPWISTSPIAGDFRFGTPRPAISAARPVPAGPVAPPPGGGFDGRYEGTAPGLNIAGCMPVAFTITVARGRVSGSAVIIGQYPPFQEGLFTRRIAGLVAPDGSAILHFYWNGTRGMPIPGRFLAGRFQGSLGGRIQSCHRMVTLYGR